MGRKTYFIAVAAGLSFLFVYVLLFNVILKSWIIPSHIVIWIRNSIALLIIIGETVWAKKPFGRIGFYMLPLVLAGFLFMAFRWPFGSILFMSGLLIILGPLALNAVKNKGSRLTGLVVLLYPLARLLSQITSAFQVFGSLFSYSQGASSGWWTLELCITGLVALFIWFRLPNIR